MSEQELAGKVAIVTGAGRNIGRAIALALADAGAAVVVNVRSNQAEADGVVREIEAAGGKAAAHVGDVVDPKTAAALAALALAQFKRIDILVNNAALRGEKPIDADELRRMARGARRHARRRLPVHQSLPAGA